MSIVLIIVFIFIAGSYSGLETGGYLLNRIRLRFRARHGDHAACRLQKVLSDAHLFIFTVLIGHNVAVYMVSRNVTKLYLNAGFSEHAEPLFGFIPWSAEMAATLTLMLPLFLFAEIIPKNLFHRNPDTLMYGASFWLLFSWRIFRPITVVLKFLFNLLTGSRGRSEVLSGFSLSLQGLREYFSTDTNLTILSDHQQGMIDNLVAMHRISSKDLMTPISAVVSVSEKSSVEKVLEIMSSYDVEQLVVYRGAVRRLVGFVTLFDLMDPALDRSASVRSHVRKMTRISGNLPLSRAFRRLRQSSGTPVVVTDRSSQALGILRLRDIASYIASASSKTC